MELDIPVDAIVYADGAYNCFDLEDVLQDEGIQFFAKRGSKAKNRVWSDSEEKKSIVGDKLLKQHLAPSPRYLKVRTEGGLMIKVFCTVIAYSTSFLCNNRLI